MPIDQLKQQISDIYTHENLNAGVGSGLLSKGDENRINLNLLEMQTLAELAIMDYQNEYNSPSAQAQRLREAGINTDLASIDANDSSDPTSPSGFTSSPGKDPLEIANDVFNVVSTTFGMTSSLMTGGMQMFQGLADYDAKNISNVNSLLGLGTSAAGMVQPISVTDGSSDIMSDIITGSSVSDSPLPLSSRNKRRLKSLSGLIKNSPQANLQYWTNASDSESARQELAKLISSPYTADDFDEMVECFRPLTSAIAENMQKQLTLESSRLDYDQSYYDEANQDNLGVVSAQSDYASRSLSRGQDSMLNQLKAPLQSLIKNLDTKAQEGKSWANFALIALYTVLSATVTGGNMLK